jgi:outer membrane receptor protein involved in Fe transport
MLRSAFDALRRAAGVLAVILFAVPSWAGTTGKLSGRVINEKKEPLAGVNIRIEGQRLGAFSDAEGNYFIIGIPGGTYLVHANLLGHAPYTAENVQITPDFTTTLDITLRTEAIQQAEVRVEAERPLIQKDATGTARFISSEELQKMPTRGYRDAAAQQTGTVNFRRNIDTESQNANTLIIRGGRPNETAYYVDGFSQQDPLTGTSSTSISGNAIEEVVVLTGGFNAEYGRIMSGAVNVITREGASKYFGAVEAVSDVLAGDWVGSERTDFNVYDVSVGGPLWPGNEDLSFYVSGERRWQRDRSPSMLAENYRDALTGLGLDPNIKPVNSTGGYTFQGKLGWQMNDMMNVKVGGLGSEEDWREYSHAYLYNLDHSPKYHDRNVSYFGTFNHVLSPSMFYNIGTNYFETTRKRGDGIAFDNLNSYYRASNPRFDEDVPLFFEPGHVFDDYLQRNSSYYGIQGSITSQINRHNQLKAGGDYQRHTLRYFNHFFPVQLGGTTPNLTDWDGYGYDLVQNPDGSFRLLENNEDSEDGPKHPKTWSLYAQDKFEREGVILNAGMRFDHINVDTQALLSEEFPLGDPDAIDNLPDVLEEQDLQENRTYSRLSPRLGVAFPVDERTLLRFNYGQFYQQPNLQDLYVSYRFLEHKVRTGGYFVGFGNPNLKPEQTTAYEFGMARQIGERSRLDITAYYKDVKDLVQIINIPSFPNSFSSYRNTDFATVKGIDVGFSMRRTNHITAGVNYSLCFAQGTGSVSNTQANIAWTSAEPPKQTAPLDFDQRHKVSFNFDYSLLGNEGPAWGNMKPFANTSVNILYNVGSGTPYTPTNVYNEVTLANVNSTPNGPLNSKYGPWTSALDLKASKGFRVGGSNMEAFVWALNVLDSKNPFQVYTSSGAHDVVGFLTTEPGQEYLDTASAAGKDGAGLYHLAENNPVVVANPRLVRFGIRASF